MHFETGSINHSELYSECNGKHTNGVESWFSRLCRMVSGQHHRVSHKYLYQYTDHAAWMEGYRRRSNGANAFSMLSGSLKHPIRRTWKGNRQRANAA